MCICEKDFMNNASWLIAVVHREEQLGARREAFTWIMSSKMFEREIGQWSGHADSWYDCAQGPARLLFIFPLFAFPSVHTRPWAAVISSLESSVLQASWWVVGRVQVCTVGRTAATPLQTLPVRGLKPLTKPERGTAVDRQPGPC